MTQDKSSHDDDYDDANLMQLLISSDIHLGYAENDQNRCNDCFNTFEELLRIDVEYGVDMVILGLGGNLFHKNQLKEQR